MERFKKLDPDNISVSGYLICTIEKRANLPFSNVAVPWWKIHELLEELEEEE